MTTPAEALVESIRDALVLPPRAQTTWTSDGGSADGREGAPEEEPLLCSRPRRGDGWNYSAESVRRAEPELRDRE